jgi:hypothetical protein
MEAGTNNVLSNVDPGKDTFYGVYKEEPDGRQSWVADRDTKMEAQLLLAGLWIKNKFAR